MVGMSSEQKAEWLRKHAAKEREERAQELPGGFGFEVELDTEIPTLEKVKKFEQSLFIFDSSERHPRISLLLEQENCAFITTTR